MRLLLDHPATPWTILALAPVLLLGCMFLLAGDMPKPDFRAYVFIAMGFASWGLLAALPPVAVFLFWRRYQQAASLPGLAGLILAVVACAPCLMTIVWIGGLLLAAVGDGVAALFQARTRR